MDKRFCSICAWRGNCQKRFIVCTDTLGNVHCADFTRDVAIKDEEIDSAEAVWQEAVP